jgi:hypothetical protein
MLSRYRRELTRSDAKGLGTEPQPLSDRRIDLARLKLGLINPAS